MERGEGEEGGWWGGEGVGGGGGGAVVEQLNDSDLIFRQPGGQPSCRRKTWRPSSSSFLSNKQGLLHPETSALLKRTACDWFISGLGIRFGDARVQAMNWGPFAHGRSAPPVPVRWSRGR